jgi:N-methylhydantoinase A
VWELDVPVPARLERDDDVRSLEEAFHATHERIFAVREPGQYLECLLWKSRATAVPEKPALRPRRSAQQMEPQPEEPVEAYFSETGFQEVARYDGGTLPAGMRIVGPGIIREPTTTVVVYPGSTATITRLGNYLLDVDAEPDGRGAEIGDMKAVAR